ncbi:MAG: peptidoglycan DD-metalloendopeptidase family protein [Acidobacteria bacterium]|nr:peptidoglycan DD-metalloendopeptidase family protein [Acidobacteriota bacterium]
MTTRSTRGTKKNTRNLILFLCALGVLSAPRIDSRPSALTQDQASSKRVADRLRALRDEAEELTGREKTILNELRTLELERQITTEEIAGIEKDLKTTEGQLAAAAARTASLRQSADTAGPDVEARLVRLYKMGRAGYWRLLLDVGDLQSMGRAYRTAAALTQLDRTRVEDHAQTLEALVRAEVELATRSRELGELRSKAAAARLALDRAVGSRAAYMKSLVSQRDLAAQLASELDAAHLRLQAALAQSPAGGSAAVTVPIKPFRGELSRPADGIVITRFGRQQAGRLAGIEFVRNGVELSLPEGSPVTAVHDGVISQAGPFAGYGSLVIVDHGDGAVSLYGHLAATSVNKGDRVSAGSRVGSSGRNTVGNPTLYFELRVDGKPVDPLQWLRK